MIKGMDSIPRLVIKEQPPKIWFKDIGGKKDTFMTFRLALEGTVSKHHQWALHVDLFFEDRRRVEDKFQSILKTLHNSSSPPIVNHKDRFVHFQFRIEKVSKNFMGQKFRVRCYARAIHPIGFEGVSQSVQFQTPDLVPVFSDPIESRSKRSGSNRAPSPSRKRRNPPGADSADMERILSELRSTQEKLSQTQNAFTKMVMVLQQCVTRLGAVEEATERSASGSEKVPEKPEGVPPLKRQRSATPQVFKTSDNQRAFFNVMTDGTDKILPRNTKKDTKIGETSIPPLLRQFSQEFRDTKGDFPVLEQGHGILPPRIATDDLNTFLTHLPGVDRSLTPSFITQMSVPPIPDGPGSGKSESKLFS